MNIFTLKSGSINAKILPMTNRIKKNLETSSITTKSLDYLSKCLFNLNLNDNENFRVSLLLGIYTSLKNTYLILGYKIPDIYLFIIVFQHKKTHCNLRLTSSVYPLLEINFAGVIPKNISFYPENYSSPQAKHCSGKQF